MVNRGKQPGAPSGFGGGDKADSGSAMMADEQKPAVTGATGHVPPCNEATPAVTGAVTGLDRRIQGLLGQQLKIHYRALVEEKVPDRFVSLLEELARKEVASKEDPQP